MARTPEGKVKDKVVALLKQYDAYYFFPVTGGYGKSGVPDIVACVRGVFVGIECKADLRRNKPTPLQEQQLTAISEAGGVALVVDANTIDALATALEMVHSQAKTVLCRQ